MATAELARPGVEVYQKVRAKSPTFLRPTLAPVVVGPAFEVIDVLTSDGTLNSKAKYGAYGQLSKVITHSAFPDPRGNIDELSIQLDTVKPYLMTGGRLTELPMSPGESFLIASHVATKARFVLSGATFAVQGLNVVLAVDVANSLDQTKNVTVTFSGSSPLTAQQVCDAINTAFGMTLAEVTVNGSNVINGLTISSPTYGAQSNITVRPGGSANQLLGIGWNASAGQEQRVEGAGYRAYNTNTPGSTKSTWVEFYRGDYLAAGVSVADAAWPATAQHVLILTGAVKTVRSSALTFGTGNTIPVLKGDLMIADGVRVAGGDISYVDNGKFRMGTVNSLLSTADAQGNYISKVYDDATLGLTSDDSPFCPTYVWFRAIGLSPATGSTAGTLSMTNTGTAATAAHVDGTTAPDLSLGVVLQALKIDYVLTVNGVETVDSFSFSSSSTYTTMDQVAAAISIPGIAASNAAGKLRLTTVAKGVNQAITVAKTGSANSVLGLSTSTDVTATGVDGSIANLANTSLKFKLDFGAHEYAVTFLSNSLQDALAAINQTVGGTVAALDGNGTKVVLTSLLFGVGSNVTITGANTILGFALNATDDGSGRPNPDAYTDVSGNLLIGADLVRDPITGYPLDPSTSPASLYIQYKALRLDVSPAAQVAGVLRLPDITTLGSVLDPIDETNPLALGCYLGMLNCPTFEFKALGVDEVSGSAPEGTELAYARAAAMLEAEEVYAIAPLTQNEVVHSTFNTHVILMSEPEQMGERVLLFNKAQPTRKTSKVAASGTDASSGNSSNVLSLGVTPQQGLIDAGVNPVGPIPVSAGVYVEFSWQGVFYRYNVSSVSGALATLNKSFASGENDDLFYTTAEYPTGLAALSWTMKVRGASLMIPGTNPAKPDYSLVASTVAEGNAGIANRRAFSFFPATVKTTIAGLTKSLPGYYGCAAYAGLIAGLPPQQGLTNYPVTGLTGVSGTEKFTKRQLNVMAGGGTFILMQEVDSGPVFCRHQLSTDVSAVETRELSVTKVVDFTAKFLRGGIRRFIGRQNINAVFLDTIGTTITGMLQFLVENGILNGFNLNNIIQDEKNPDTVLVDVTLDVPFPCNYIKLTLVV